MKTLKKIFASLPKLLIDSLVVAFAILGGIDIVMSLIGVQLDWIGGLPARIGAVLLAYVVLVVLVAFVKQRLTKNEIVLDIRGLRVSVREGDIFTENGWKLIPFNEYFDTQVDDKIIAHESLNGKFIDSLSDTEKQQLKQAIIDDNSSPLETMISPDGSKVKYELGTIKVFESYMMLALTHFNAQNEGHTNRAEYEHTLRKMWREIRRVHQGKVINIPLVGGGLTQLDDMAEKPNEQLLKCILCTLRTSSVTFGERTKINIILTKDTLESINLYELRREQ